MSRVEVVRSSQRWQVTAQDGARTHQGEAEQVEAAPTRRRARVLVVGGEADAPDPVDRLASTSTRSPVASRYWRSAASWPNFAALPRVTTSNRDALQTASSKPRTCRPAL